MDIYFAPMEGITDHIYRRAHRSFYPGVARYYMPFLSPTQNHIFPPRELRQIAPENNAGVPAIPQLLTRNAGDFLWAAEELASMGYEEVDLNVGCSSGTVTAKGKGAGLLDDTDGLRRLLDGIFGGHCPVKVSVKTRLGMRRAEDFFPVLDIYNDYPLAELVIHPRTKTEMYGGAVHMDVFSAALERSRAPVCYNGDIRSAPDIATLAERFPGLKAVMIGRGLAARPFLLAVAGDASEERRRLYRFHRRLCEDYCQAFGGPDSAIHRMKSIWSYMLDSFAGGRQFEKALGKARRWPDFLAVTDTIFAQCEMMAGPETEY